MKTKCQNVLIDLDNYKDLERKNNIPYNITITRSKKDPIHIPSFFLSYIKFNKIKFKNVYNIVGIGNFFMSGSKCVNNNKMKFYFPDLETIGRSFLSNFKFNNKITFKFPRLKEIDCFCGANINYYVKNTLSELTIECDRTFESKLFSFSNAQLNKLTIPSNLLFFYQYKKNNINKTKIYIPKRTIMIPNEIII